MIGRAALVVVASTLVGAALTRLAIAWLPKFGLRQKVRRDGPSEHLTKEGTITGGGIALVLALLTAAFWAGLTPRVLASLILICGLAVLGLFDDWLGIFGNKGGLGAWRKVYGQVFVAVIFAGLVLGMMGQAGGVTWLVFWLHLKNPLLYLLLILLVVVSAANAVNLTDGLDGLAGGTVATILLAYVLICLPTQPDLAVLAAVGLGACLGFVWFNFYPAKLFMGNVGALSLGGLIAALAVFSHTELLLLLIGGLIVLEVLSVILQVSSFKLRGKRILAMAPLHHHFELTGWKEPQVVLRFWLVSLLFALSGVFIYYLLR